MCTTDELNLVFDEVGKQFGFLTVKADFEEFEEMKVKWQRGHNWIEFKISDYLKDAPKEAIEDLAQSMYKQILGKDRLYGERMTQYLKDPEYAKKNRPTYMNRSKNLMCGSEGDAYDLKRIYDGLVKKGLIEDKDDDIALTWAVNDMELFGTSTLMKVASISYALDLKTVPEEVVEAAVYEAVQTIRAGQRDFGKKGGMKNDWANHPQMHAALRWCEENGMAF